MDRVTLIVVPHETEPVRRFRVPRALLRHGAWVALLLAFGMVGGLADWVRLRVDAVEVARLRVEASTQRDRLEELARSVRAVEEDLERIREFERKVRVIADLPESMLEVSAPRSEPSAAGEEQGLPSGPAGGEGAPWDAGLAEPRLASGRIHAAAAGIVELLRRRAEELSGRAQRQGGSLESILEQLDGKRRQLAATPSIWPTDGWVTSGYGYRSSPFTGRREFHRGIDIAADAGTPILAPARGKVVYVGRRGALGQSVTLDHGYGIRSSYGHASQTFVELGQQVQRGDPVAAVGNSGRSTGPHLHYAVHVAGKSVNPADYILE